MIFSLLNNPLTKLAVSKVSDHFKHRAEKVETIRQAEIEYLSNVSKEMKHYLKQSQLKLDAIRVAIVRK